MHAIRADPPGPEREGVETRERLPRRRARADAHAQKLQFRQPTPDNGLSSSQIQTIGHDGRGFVRAGTREGLDRCDGYGFTVYRHRERDCTSLRNARVIQHNQREVESAVTIETISRVTHSAVTGNQTIAASVQQLSGSIEDLQLRVGGVPGLPAASRELAQHAT